MSPTSARAWRKLATFLIWGGLLVIGCFLLGAALSALSSMGGPPDGGGGAAQARHAAAEERTGLLFRLAIGGGVLAALGWVIRNSVAEPEC